MPIGAMINPEQQSSPILGARGQGGGLRHQQQNRWSLLKPMNSRQWDMLVHNSNGGNAMNDSHD